MGSSVEIVLMGRDQSASAAIDQMARVGKNATDRLANDFETLGTRSTVAINAERASVVSAFERIKTSGVASYDEIARASMAMEAKMSDLAKEQSGAGIKQKFAEAASESRNLAGGVDLVSSAMGLLGTAVSGVAFMSLIGDMRAARIEMDAIKNSLAAAVDSKALGAAEFEYVARRADYLGLSIRTVAKDYAQMTASAKGTTLEGEGARKVFEGITTASTALHLSQERVHLIMTAVNQMMSKGTVMAEELKGQLGESLPGAYQMAAKAMGVTTAELSKQMELGKVMASDLLPKLAEEMEKRFGKQIPEAIKSTQAEMNRLDNAMFKLKLTMADSGLFASLAKGATQTAEAGQTTIKWMGQAKAFWGGMAEKAAAWVEAGGLIGVLTGGKDKNTELQAKLKAIDDMMQYSWDKWNERAGDKQPLADKAVAAAQKQQAVDAALAKTRENAAKAKEQADKRAEDQLKTASDAIKKYGSLVQDIGKERLILSKDRFSETLKQEIDQFKQYGNTLTSSVRGPLEAYLADIEQVYAQRQKGAEASLAALKQLEVASRSLPKKNKDDAQIKDLYDYTKAVKEQQIEIQKIERDGLLNRIEAHREYFKTLEQMHQTALNDYLAKEKAVEDSRKATADSIKSLQISLVPKPEYKDAFDEYMATRDLLSSKEAEARKLEKPEERVKGLQEVSDAWKKLNQPIQLGTDLIVTREEATQRAIENIKRLGAEITSERNTEANKAGDVVLEIERRQAAELKLIDSMRGKIVDLDSTIARLTKEITLSINDQASPVVERIKAAIAGMNNVQLVFSARSNAISSGASSNYSDNTDYSETALYNAVGADVYNSWPTFATGTNRITKSGVAFVDEDEAIVPAQYNGAYKPPAESAGAPSITIQGGIPITIVGSNKNPAEIADEVARTVVSRINQLQSQRFRKTG